jgi:hypothetical protein
MTLPSESDPASRHLHSMPCPSRDRRGRHAKARRAERERRGRQVECIALHGDFLVWLPAKRRWVRLCVCVSCKWQVLGYRESGEQSPVSTCLDSSEGSKNIRGNSGMDFSLFAECGQCHLVNFEPALCAYNLSSEAVQRANRSRPSNEEMDEFCDHFGGYPKSAGRTFTGGAALF